MERKKAVKFITAIMLAVTLSLSLVVACPPFSITSKAAESNQTVWHLDAQSTNLLYGGYSSGWLNTRVNSDVNKSYFKKTFDLSAFSDKTGNLEVQYTSFDCTYHLRVQRVSSTAYVDRGGAYAENLNPCLYDNLGNIYLLDENGGFFVIEDISNITTLTFGYAGHVDYTVTYNPSTTKFSSYSMYCDNTAFDIMLSTVAPKRIITDSEGTVWTVPDEIENPVVIKSGSNKKLIDGVTGLGYFVDNVVYDGCYILASETNDLPTIYMYNEDGTRGDSPLQFRQESAEFFGIEPIYCASIPIIDEFLYGSLPEIKVTLLQPEPTESPEPSPEPSPGLLPEPVIPSGDFDTLHDLGSVDLDNSDNGGMVDETSVYCSGGRLVFRTKYGTRDYSEHYTYGDPCTVHIEDNCSQFIGRFTLNTEVDGYVSMMFPDLWLYPDIYWPGPQYFVENIDQNETYPQIMKLFEYAEPIIVLYANGEKYTVSPYGGSVQIPVNKGENIVIMEIVLQVKDDFAIVPAQSFYLTYECNLEDFSVYIREYKDVVTSAVEDIKGTLENQLEESKKQTEALTKYENADKMDSDNDKLTGAIGDYNEISDSLFESAGGSMSDFDLGSAFTYSSHLLAAFGFLATVITSIIQQMGWYSILYPIGIALVIIGALLGLSKYMSSAGPGEMPKDDGLNHPYRPDPTHERLPDHSKK